MTSSKKVCGVYLSIVGSARWTNTLGPRILDAKLLRPFRISLPRILWRSWMISQPNRHPGTKNLFVSPLHVRTGTSSDNEDNAWNLWPEKTKCSYISSAMIGTWFLVATSSISSKCSLSYTDPQGFDGFITIIAAVSSSIWLSKSSISTFHCSSGCKI